MASKVSTQCKVGWSILALFLLWLFQGQQIEAQAPSADFSHTPLFTGQNITYMQFTSDGQRIVYTVNEREIYVITLPAGPPTLLDDLSTRGEVISFIEITADGQYAVYRTEPNSGLVNLYSAKLTTEEEPVYLDTAFYTQHYISLDGSHVVYQVDKNGDDKLELYSISMAGGIPILLSNATTLSWFSISPDSRRVVYVTDNDELYSVPLTGGVSTRLSSMGYIFLISPDSNYVVYIGRNLYKVPIDGGSSMQLAESASTLSITPDQRYVVYQSFSPPGKFLYSVPMSGGLSRLLAQNYYDYRVSPSRNFVIYRADQNADDDLEIYSLPISEGSPRLLSEVSYKNYSPSIFQNGYVFYLLDSIDYDLRQIHNVPVAGGASNLLADSVSNYRVDFNGDVLYYTMPTEFGEQLYTIPITTGEPVFIAETTDGRTIKGILFNPKNSCQSIYRFYDEETDTSSYYLTRDERPQLTFLSDATVVEETTAQIPLTIQLNSTSTLTTTVDYSVVSGTAKDGGVDYTLGNGTLTFAPNETTKTITVDIHDDDRAESDETVMIALSNPQNGTFCGAADEVYATHWLTIENDDMAWSYLPVIFR